jgi:hypothetical protein
LIEADLQTSAIPIGEAIIRQQSAINSKDATIFQLSPRDSTRLSPETDDRLLPIVLKDAKARSRRTQPRPLVLKAVKTQNRINWE